MHLSKFAGWRGVLIGIVLVGLGVWAFVYTCNTETAACKGVVPWPFVPGLLHTAGWVAATLGLVIVVVALITWLVRAVRSRRPEI